MTDFERRKALYDYLCKNPDRWHKQAAIADSLPMEYGIAEGFFPFSGVRRTMTDDIKCINEDTAFQFIIISGTRGCKIANAAEAERFCRSEASEIFKKLRRLRSIERKLAINGQVHFNGSGTDIIKSVFDAQ